MCILVSDVAHADFLGSPIPIVSDTVCCGDNSNMKCNPGLQSERDCISTCMSDCPQQKGGFCKNHKCHCFC